MLLLHMLRLQETQLEEKWERLDIYLRRKTATSEQSNKEFTIRTAMKDTVSLFPKQLLVLLFDLVNLLPVKV